MSESPFLDAAATYLERGWSVFPLPSGKKSPPPKGVTGYGAQRLTLDDLARARPDSNLGVWAAPGLLGIDVDAYVKGAAGGKTSVTKTGDVTLAELEKLLGPLPTTIVSSARELPSGIRWFSVPDDVLFITKLVGIEFIQPTHRYGVVAPSTNPDADGASYQWWLSDGTLLDDIPYVSQAAALPVEFIEHLTRSGNASRTTGVRSASDVTEVKAWLSEFGAGEPCRAVRGVLRAHVATLDDGTSRYENAIAGQMALLHLVVEGHPGVSWAMPQLKAAYLEAVSGEDRGIEAEWRRGLVEGIGKQMKYLAETDHKVTPHPPGKCPDVKVSPFSDASLWPAPTAPFEVADRYVRETHSIETELTLRSWRGDYYTWRGSHWKPFDEIDLTAHLYNVLRNASYQTAAAQPVEAPWRPTPPKIAHVMGAMTARVLRATEADADDSSGAGISFANGVLDLETRVLKPHSPSWFNLSALPYSYDPDAPEPVEWLKFLATLWDDGEEIELLQEWLGYLLSGRIDAHTMAILVGPTRAGKGVITHICEALVGADNHAGLRVSNLTSAFGLERAIGKTLLTIGDARFSSREARESVEALLGIVGGDEQDINRKNRRSWGGVLPGRFMISTNEPPAIPDPSGAIVARMVLLVFRRSFKDNPDRGLLPRLKTELPGIFNWALEGYDRAAIGKDYIWTEPTSSVEMKTDIEELGSPVLEFLRDCCKPSATGTVSKEKVYEAWSAWCGDHGRHATSYSVFFRDLYVAKPGLRKVRHGSGRDGEPREQAVGGLVLREGIRGAGDLR